MNSLPAISEPAGEIEKSPEAYLDGIENLPPTPVVLVKLIDLFRQPDVDVDDIVQLLRRDPALAMEVLRCCNNSFFGNGNTIKDVNEAVYRLGFHEVYEITVTLFGLRALTAPTAAPGFPAAELRRHSSIAAIAAGALARDTGLPEGIAFTTALLHDLGKLAFAIADPARYVALLDHCRLSGAAVSAVEQETFGFTHSELGAQLLRRWGMPEEVVLPVLGHASPAAPERTEPLRVLTQSASELANHLEAKSGGMFSATPEGKRLMEFFGLDPHDVDGWECMMRAKVKHLDSSEPL
ncbi:MAG: HDOD domain-containing protein [Verrucomicrobiae bacterium]|nr:HDOD domain-containing protein [Verrucomicrobiae bacterium]